MNELSFIFLRVTWPIYGVNTFFMFFLDIQEFKGSILFPGLHLRCVFAKKTVSFVRANQKVRAKSTICLFHKSWYFPTGRNGIPNIPLSKSQSKAVISQ